MDLTQFRATVAQGAPPDGISLALQTLWWDAKGDWNRAHGWAQQVRLGPAVNDRRAVVCVDLR
jgi:hypothetical protein